MCCFSLSHQPCPLMIPFSLALGNGYSLSTSLLLSFPLEFLLLCHNKLSFFNDGIVKHFFFLNVNWGLNCSDLLYTWCDKLTLLFRNSIFTRLPLRLRYHLLLLNRCFWTGWAFFTGLLWLLHHLIAVQIILLSGLRRIVVADSLLMEK